MLTSRKAKKPAMYGCVRQTIAQSSYTTMSDGYSRTTNEAHASTSLPLTKLTSTPPTSRRLRVSPCLSASRFHAWSSVITKRSRRMSCSLVHRALREASVVAASASLVGDGCAEGAATETCQIPTCACRCRMAVWTTAAAVNICGGVGWGFGVTTTRIVRRQSQALPASSRHTT